MTSPAGAARALLARLFDAAIAALEPTALVARVLRVDDGGLIVRGRGAHAPALRVPLARGVLVVGAGKGAATLAAAVESVLGDRVRGGVVIVPRGYEWPLRRIAVARGGHPVPTAASVAATARLLACIRHARGVPVIIVLTGGASALLVQPAAGLTLADKQRTTRLLLRSSATIDEVNVVRKHLSAVKGGGLGALLAGRGAVALVVSDVPGDDLATIGSGPTIPDPSTAADALAVLAKHRLLTRVPAAVTRHLERDRRDMPAKTRKRSAASTSIRTVLVAGNATARRGAVRAARRAGIPMILEARRPIIGSGAAAADELAARIAASRAALGDDDSRALIVAGGETTVAVGSGTGRGGRNQELALRVARRLGGEGGWAILCAGTDGIDGPTPAAGAFADGDSLKRAARVGGDVDDALRRHDVFPLLAAMGDTFSPGPTGTNVADLVLALVWK